MEKYIPLILVFALTLACSKEADIKSDCLNDVLQQKGMVKYQGEELGCNMFLELYHFKAKQYFIINNHCADMSAFPYDCKGNNLCKDYYNPDCLRFSREAEYKGIVGIKIKE